MKTCYLVKQTLSPKYSIREQELSRLFGKGYVPGEILFTAETLKEITAYKRENKLKLVEY